jgi:hypothetical protein
MTNPTAPRIKPATRHVATTDATAGPCHALTSWWLAVEARDFKAALRLTRELRRGWRIVVHLADPAKGGPR